MKTINQKDLIKILNQGYKNLEKHKQYINELNVFPVPDGDTGTNMCMTMASGCENINKQNFTTTAEVAKAFSRGLLLGGRGNSGVITSQFFRGMAEGLEKTSEITQKDFTKALIQGQVRAYGSVIEPVEGTILTVIRETSEKMSEHSDFADFDLYLKKVIEHAKTSLSKTPELLPVLKEAGVVDSGGQGLVTILEGMLIGLNGAEVEIDTTQNFEEYIRQEEHPMDPNEITFSFCTEMLVELKNHESFDLQAFIQKLNQLGDSIVAIDDENILKCHIHTEEPLKVYQMGFDLGRIITLKAENMKIQAEEAQKQRAAKVESSKPETNELREQGIIAVASSEGVGNIFNKICKVGIVSGGQTLNPSINDIVEAGEKANVKNLFVFPNNSNIILAAESAAKILNKKGINTYIIPTKFMTQAIEALMIFDKNQSAENNFKEMIDAIKIPENVEVTKAIRDTEIEGLKIKENDNLFLVQGKIVYSEADVMSGFTKLINNYINEDTEVVVLIAGVGHDPKVIDQIKKLIHDIDDMIDINLYESDQPVYPYLLSII